MTMMLAESPGLWGRIRRLLRADARLRYKAYALIATVLAGLGYLGAQGLQWARVHGHAPMAGASITPITNTSGGASGISFSGDSYVIYCTTSAATGTMYPAMHDGTGWNVYYSYPCTWDGSVTTKIACIFPAQRGSGLTWNAFKTGSATLSSCTAEQRFSASPFPSPPASSGGGAFTPVLTKLTSGSGNWTPTAGATMVRVILIGGGGGGGSGRQGTNNSSSGGGGGGAGGYAEAIYAISDLTTPVAYSVGAGGAGGAAKAFNADGNSGSAGAVTTFGSYLRAGGGGGGGGGTTTTGTQGSSAGSTWTGTQLGGAGSNSNGNYAGAQDPFTLTLSIGLFLGQGPGAGGGGGGGSTSSTRIGGTGGFRPIYASGGAVGGQTLGAAGAAGAAGLPVGMGGAGGAGGNQASTPGGAGGNGGNYGGGGGGGGGSCTDGVTGQPSGKGGDGAGGVIWIFESHLLPPALPRNDNAEPRRMVA